MKKWQVLFIGFMGVALSPWALTLESQAATFCPAARAIHNQLTIDHDAPEYSKFLALVKKGGGKGKKHHRAQGDRKRKGKPEHVGNGKKQHRAKKRGEGKGRPEGAGRGNSGESKLRGLDRADDVAGEHGQRGRAKAREKRGRGQDDGEE